MPRTPPRASPEAELTSAGPAASKPSSWGFAAQHTGEAGAGAADCGLQTETDLG